MKKPFADACWIWYTKDDAPDTYGDFSDRFHYSDGKVICRISCDGDYTLWVNGIFVSSNQYGDFEHYKIYDSIDITAFLNAALELLLKISIRCLRFSLSEVI